LTLAETMCANAPAAVRESLAVARQASALPENELRSLSDAARRRVQATADYETVYCARGDMENRLKEAQGDLFADRTSTATMRANQRGGSGFWRFDEWSFCLTAARLAA